MKRCPNCDAKLMEEGEYLRCVCGYIENTDGKVLQGFIDERNEEIKPEPKEEKKEEIKEKPKPAPKSEEKPKEKIEKKVE
ncbi:MAG: hypothetical protein ACTSR2_02505 [Candidatus Hodarchaeales archaeon]